MNISQYSGNSILDLQSRNREDPRLRGGTSIQPILPIKPLGEGEQNGQGPEAGNEASFGTLINTVIDSVNPLQHIPGVSMAYRETTGDEINPVSAMAGGFLFGGPVGLLAGAATSFLEMVTGKSVAQHAMSMFSGDPEQTQGSDTEMAQIGDGSPLLQRDQGVSLQHYQAFANATADTNLGIGADPSTVAWASNTWSSQALRQAIGAYEGGQNNQASANGRINRFG